MASQTATLTAWGARRRPDEDLFERTLRGDPVAFSEVYRRYQKRIYGYCLARSLDPDTAADATQEVFMRLLRAEPGSIDNPKGWLFTVARNVVIDVARKRARTPEDGGLDEASLAWEHLKAADTADEVMARSDAKDVFLALSTIRPRYRTAMVMRDVHGESAVAMAEALETTPGAVDTLVSRARDAFGAAYASVRDLPTACRACVELIYRDLGSGITSEERAALDDHLDSCERCRAEYKKAHNPRRMSALLPFLIPAKRLGQGLIERAAMVMGSVPDAAAQQAPVVLSQPHTWNLATKIGAGILAAAIVTAPIAATEMRHSARTRQGAQSQATRSMGSTSRWSGRGSGSWSSGMSSAQMSSRWFNGQLSPMGMWDSWSSKSSGSGGSWSSGMTSGQKSGSGSWSSGSKTGSSKSGSWSSSSTSGSSKSGSWSSGSRSGSSKSGSWSSGSDSGSHDSGGSWSGGSSGGGW